VSPLREPEDAYGQILLAVLEGRGGQEIMEREDGLIYCGDPSDYFAPFRRWPKVERRAMRYVRGRVLDIGCGAGRVALHLQERGHEVVAIDESPLAVEVARRRGVENAVARSIAEIDPSFGVFDTILLLRNNFGLAGPEPKAGAFLRLLHALSSGRGRIVTDSVHPDRLEDWFASGRATSGRTLRIRVRWRHYASPWFRYLFLTPEDFERVVDGTGWRVGRILDDGSPRFVAILDKLEHAHRRLKARSAIAGMSGLPRLSAPVSTPRPRASSSAWRSPSSPPARPGGRRDPPRA
jgi:SAM-dependent methyltransferase